MSNSHLPTDLLNEVLLKLPVKSLIRFTSVCKSWQSLITSPTFISSHLSASTENHCILTSPTFISFDLPTENHDILGLSDKHGKCEKQKHYALLKVTENGLDSFTELEFPFKSGNQYYRLVGSCHGLVCLSDCNRANRSQNVIIWNPSIRTHVVIPKPVFNPEEPHMFVFGFGVADHVYKVVRIGYSQSHFPRVSPVADIFSLGTGTWRRVEAFDIGLQFIQCMWRQIFFKGVVHWVAGELTIDNDQCSYRSSILTFEVGDEVFGEVMLPDELARLSVTRLRLFTIGESLGVIKDGSGYTRCDVWMMNEYGVKESWTEIYTIDFGSTLQTVVGFCMSGEALLVVPYIPGTTRSELVAYITKTRRNMNLGIYGYPWSFYINNYVESLLLLKEGI